MVKKLNFIIKKKEVVKPKRKLNFIIKKKEAVKPVRKLNFKINPKRGKVKQGELTRVSGLSRAEANAMSPLELFGKLPSALRGMIATPSKRGGGVTVGTPLKFNPNSGLLSLGQYNSTGQEYIGAIINSQRANLRKQLNRMLKKKGGKAFKAKDAGRIKLAELQKRLMAVGVSRAELEKIFKSYANKAENEAGRYIGEKQRKARDPSEGVYA
tara:strand:- start:2223 stop:2858 length:636 start_codon:yes stop_codon:yes gene_type:complete